jgi:tripeptide aminopeptidase
VREICAQAKVRRAFDFFNCPASAITDTHIKICEIPASPFHERARAEFMCALFRGCNLTDVHIDEAGNAVALRRGRAPSSPLTVISAHLDTVFPVGTDFTVRRDGEILRAPGISDDGCGLAAIVAIARALGECEIETEGSILFVATVGEEGEGNLRGARHLLTESEWANRVDAFISLDGPGLERITHRALGSRRWRVRVVGAGGHSWGDFGAANPIHALGRAVARLATYPVPSNPRTTFNVGRIEGGASVNCIPSEAIMDVDLRSESSDELRRLDSFFRRAVSESMEDENRARRSDASKVMLEMKLIGDRPGGETPPQSQIVRLAEEATKICGFLRPRLDCASTDSNIAISLGIPAITIGAGGLSGNTHTTAEWYDPTGRADGLRRALIILLGLTG